MEATLQALGQILLQALPTFFLVLFLHFFLKAVFFGPLSKVLHERKQATEVARQQAEASLKRAQEKAAAYEESLRAARNELYKEQEAQRQVWRDEQSAQIAAARRQGEDILRAARAEIAVDAEAARKDLESTSAALADQITRTVLRGDAR